ncbi:bacteriohemerythrin [Bdellovibrionota bacterium FG-1]
MALFEWSSRFTLGIQSIDDEHKKLVEYINQLHDGMMQGKGANVTGPILDGLVNYTVKHFKHEEELFATHAYPDTAAHKEEHKKLVAQVAEFQTKFKAGTATISTEIMTFLKNWLTNHILGTDKKYCPHLISKGVK